MKLPMRFPCDFPSLGACLLLIVLPAGCSPLARTAPVSSEGLEAPAAPPAAISAAATPAETRAAAQPPAPAGAAPQVVSAPREAPPPPPNFAPALDRGANWLIKKQNPDGGYGPRVVAGGSDVGITAFVLYALGRSPRKYRAHDGPYVSNAVDFLLARQQPDGGICDPKEPSLQNYKTSVVILALTTLDPVKYAEPIRKATAFVKSQQFSSESGNDPERHLSFGGIGAGSDQGRSDLSNTQLAMDALVAAGVSGTDELWVRAQRFIERSQNLKEVDPLLKEAGIGTTGDGGFRYAPTMTRGNEETIDGLRVFSSYGSMTYAGIKSFLYAGVSKNDPRVQAAYAWIKKNFTVKENPGMATAADPSRGQQGLFYYFHTMAKALSVYGEPEIVDDHGRRHLWASELGSHIASLQLPDGSWDNPAERWMEGVEVLTTSYAIVALSICQEEVRRRTEDPLKPSGAESGSRK